MRQRVSSWVVCWVMSFGVLLLMIGSRPDLQRIGTRDGPGSTIQVVGHGLTWSAVAVLSVRLVRTTRASLREEAAERERTYELAVGRARVGDRPADKV